MTMLPCATALKFALEVEGFRSGSTTAPRALLADPATCPAGLPGDRLPHARHRRPRAGRSACARGRSGACHPDQRPRQPAAARTGAATLGRDPVLEKPLSDAALVESIRRAALVGLSRFRMAAMPRTIIGYVLRYHRHASGGSGGPVGRRVPAERRPAGAAAPHRQRAVEHGAFDHRSLAGSRLCRRALAEQPEACAQRLSRLGGRGPVRRLRDTVCSMRRRRASADSAEDAGVEISMVLDEVEPIGGFIGISVSEPLLQGGILVSVIGYMLVSRQPAGAARPCILPAPDGVRAAAAERPSTAGAQIAHPDQARHQRRDRQTGRHRRAWAWAKESDRTHLHAEHGHLQAEVLDEPADEPDASPRRSRSRSASAAGWCWRANRGRHRGGDRRADWASSTILGAIS